MRKSYMGICLIYWLGVGFSGFGFISGLRQ